MQQRSLHLDRIGYAFIAVLLAFSSISTDLYLPAMPTMAKEWGARDGLLEFSVSAYLAGFAIGQLFWGPVSDRFGRKRPLAFGILLFVIGSLGCGFSTGVVQLISWRVVQAVGASAAVVVGRAIVADLYKGREAARVFATLTAIMVVAPLVGPMLGARILAFASWPFIFYFLAIFGIGTMVLLGRAIPESLPNESRTDSVQIFDRQAYGALFANTRLMAYAFITMVFTAGIFAYVAGSSFVFIELHDLSPDQYGLIFGAGAAAIIVANLTNARLVGRFGPDPLLHAGIINALIMTVALVICTVIGANVWFLAGFVVLYAGSNGFVQANAISAGLNQVVEGRGRASALLGCMQYGGGMIGSFVLGFIANGTAYPLFIILLATSFICLFLVHRAAGLASAS